MLSKVIFPTLILAGGVGALYYYILKHKKPITPPDQVCCEHPSPSRICVQPGNLCAINTTNRDPEDTGKLPAIDSADEKLLGIIGNSIGTEWTNVDKTKSLTLSCIYSTNSPLTVTFNCNSNSSLSECKGTYQKTFTHWRIAEGLGISLMDSLGTPLILIEPSNTDGIVNIKLSLGTPDDNFDIKMFLIS